MSGLSDRDRLLFHHLVDGASIKVIHLEAKSVERNSTKKV